MDLTLPYTLHPTALPHGLAWGLFAVALLGSLAASVAVARFTRLWVALLVSIPTLLGLLLVTIVVGAVITFFIHDQ